MSFSRESPDISLQAYRTAGNRERCDWEMRTGTTSATAHSSTVFNRASQDILQITLSGQALVFTVIGLVMAVHVLQPSLSSILIAVGPLPFIVANDFRAFIALGPGGTPTTFYGYLRITFLRLFALQAIYSPPEMFDSSIVPKENHFLATESTIPRRTGPRPFVAGIAPQRQLDQRGCRNTNAHIRRAIRALAAKHPALLQVGSSCFEKNGLALFARNPINKSCNGEICHVHASEHSFHLLLHPADAKVVLDNAWGQRHPLAKGGWWTKFVPQHFYMVYAPRDFDEGETVCKIIAAAAWWVSGQQFELSIPSPSHRDVLLQYP